MIAAGFFASKMEISDEKFKQRREEAEAYYKTVVSVKCPYFQGEQVFFNAVGFEHLIFKGWDEPRKRIDQYIRFKLLPIAVDIIKRKGFILVT